MSMRLSINAKLYRNTGTYGSPTWAEVTNCGDLTLSDSYEEANVTRRGSAGYTETEPTLRTIELSFQVFNIASDADYLAFLAAHTGRTAIDMQVLDGDRITSGTRGVRASFKVVSFTRNQSLSDVQAFDVVMKPCQAANAPTDVNVT
jgi:hypothetical protein